MTDTSLTQERDAGREADCASPRTSLRDRVRQDAGRLQDQYLQDKPKATATLAKLRRAVTAEPGTAPAVWEATLGGLPKELAGQRDEPSPGERAVHAALCLFALHQQSQRTPMHVPDVGLGTAVRRLARSENTSEVAVERRFHALGTSESVSEALRHARGLVAQLRSARPRPIPLDYGQLAVDLFDLDDARYQGAVRRRWGRDYYRTGGDAEDAFQDTSDDSASDGVNGEDQ